MMQEVRQIDHLSLREIAWMARQGFHCRSDFVAETVMKHQRRSNQIRAVLTALDVAPMTVDAVLRVDCAAARGCRIVDHLTFGGTSLTGSKCVQREEHSDCDKQSHG